MSLTPQEEIRLLQLLQAEEKLKVFQPQSGPQERFSASTADIVLYGGAAGSGKTHALLLEPLKHIQNPQFGAVFFRRETTQITTQGGMWDNACDLYPLRDGRPIKTPQMLFKFPSGARVSFRHLQYEADVHSWQGSQVPLLCWDELCAFTRKQFFYLLSRNRSTCGIKPYVRATCNPDPDSWVAGFIEWWIDQETGYPVPERSGVVRYFLVIDDQVRWGDNRQDLAAQNGMRPEDCKSFTFISASIFDNRILLEKDPGYLANLKALGTVEQARLLGGNWKIRPAAGMYFPRHKVTIVPEPPCAVVAVCRGWDLAATLPTPQNPSPDATSGVKIARLVDGRFCVLHVEHGCWSAGDVRATVRRLAEVDRTQHPQVRVRLPQDPGQAGKEQGQSYATMLAGYSVKVERVSGDKVTRAEPFSSQWLAGNVMIQQGAWNEAYLHEMEGFPDLVHEDAVDASADAFAEVALPREALSEVLVSTHEDILSGSYGIFEENEFSWS